MCLEDKLASIRPGDEEAAGKARRRWDALAKPLGSLGVLEEDIVRIAALTGDADVKLDHRVLVVVCADNGVVRQGISQTDESATSAVAAALGRGTSTINHMAKVVNCRVVPVDAGMAGETPEGVLPGKIRNGTCDISKGPAMTRSECEKTILAGISFAEEQKKKGADILLLGEMGIGNTTTTAAVTSVLLGKDAAETAGKGAGLSDEGLKRKIGVIRQAVRVNAPDPGDPLDVLLKVGGFDLAFLCGLCLGGAMYRIPVLLDGVITNAAALLAVRLCPSTRDALIASHISREPAAGFLLNELGLSPCIDAGVHLGEGAGAVLALGLLDQALALYTNGSTFQKLGIEAYKPL